MHNQNPTITHICLGLIVMTLMSTANAIHGPK